jgi:alkanesulfonate monooxygenase SsuD/methylene tetrahydromethanopterin reductase-like flavin-dependent oxidoreductase (luciferase family)
MARLGMMIEGGEGLTWDVWRQLCLDVDRLGFDSLFRSDHLFSVLGEVGRDCLECWTSLALAAEWTSKIELGPLVSPMTFRPAGILAKMAASVDVLSGGRLILGVGAGWYQAEHEQFELDFPSVGRRMDNLDAGILTIRKVLAESRPAPARRPLPLLIGGSGEKRTLRIVAKYADEWNANTAKVTPQTYVARCDLLESYCREVGRDPAAIRRSIMAGYVSGSDERELLDRAARLREVFPDFAGLSPKDVLDRVRPNWMVGTPEQVAEQLLVYARLGADRFMLLHYLTDDTDALGLLANEVIPAIA